MVGPQDSLNGVGGERKFQLIPEELIAGITDAAYNHVVFKTSKTFRNHMVAPERCVADPWAVNAPVQGHNLILLRLSATAERVATLSGFLTVGSSFRAKPIWYCIRDFVKRRPEYLTWEEPTVSPPRRFAPRTGRGDK